MGSRWGGLPDAGRRKGRAPLLCCMDTEAAAEKMVAIWRSRVHGDPRALLSQWRERVPDKEYRLTIDSVTAQYLFTVVCKRFGLEVYRRPRTRSSTVCISAPEKLVTEILWPTFEEMSRVFEDQMRLLAMELAARWEQHREMLPR